MQGVFEWISNEGSEKDKTSFRLGMRVRLGAEETLCPIGPVWDSPEAVHAGVESIVSHLWELEKQALARFRGEPKAQGALSIDPEAPQRRSGMFLRQYFRMRPL